MDLDTITGKNWNHEKQKTKVYPDHRIGRSWNTRFAVVGL